MQEVIINFLQDAIRFVSDEYVNLQVKGKGKDLQIVSEFLPEVKARKLRKSLLAILPTGTRIAVRSSYVRKGYQIIVYDAEKLYKAASCDLMNQVFPIVDEKGSVLFYNDDPIEWVTSIASNKIYAFSYSERTADDYWGAPTNRAVLQELTKKFNQQLGKKLMEFNCYWGNICCELEYSFDTYVVLSNAKEKLNKLEHQMV